MVFGNLPKYMDNHCTSQEERQQIQSVYELIYEFGDAVYDQEDSLFWKLFLQDTKYDESGVYYGRRKNKKTKFGNSINIKKRTDYQKGFESDSKLVESYTAMSMAEIENTIPDELVERIIVMHLPALCYHEERRDELERTILLQVAEGIIGCAYPNDCPIFFEALVQMPSPKLREQLEWKRFESCTAYADGSIVTSDSLRDELEPWQELIRFFENIDKKGGIHHLFSWITLKSQNCNSVSDFADSQRQQPTEKFLTNLMAVKRCGTAYGGFTDALPVSPSAGFIDKNCLTPLLRLFEQDDPDPDAIKAAIGTVTTTNGFNQYMFPTNDELGRPSLEFLEGFLKDPPEGGTTMVHTQKNNIEAVQEFAPGWFEKNFDTENQLEECSSTFVKSKDGTKQLVVHAAHFLVFTHAIAHETRLEIARDYCLHQDLMIANGHLDSVEAKEDRLRLQCFLMAMEKGTKEKAVQNKDKPSSLRFARNSVHPQGWFKNARPGIKATSDALDIHEQVLIYLRDKLGPERMRKVIESFGLMKGNASDQLAPYEPDAKCFGTPKFGNIEAKPCVCVGKKDEPNCLCYAGAKSEYHPLDGYLLCNRCLRTNMRPIQREHWRLTGNIKKLKESCKKHAEEQARYKKSHLPKVLASERYQNRNRIRTASASANQKSKSSGTNRAISNPTCFYPPKLRKMMKQSIYIFAGIQVAINRSDENPTLYNNHLITLLDEVRIGSGLDTETRYYWKEEYTRCISAFLVVVANTTKANTTKANTNTTTYSKRWALNDKIKIQIKIQPIRDSVIADAHHCTNTEIAERVAKLVLDQSQALQEKVAADKHPFGKANVCVGVTKYVQLDGDTFEMKGKHKSLQHMWDKWHGDKDGHYPDAMGGVKGRNEKFGTAWLKKNKNVPEDSYNKTKRIIKMLETRMKTEIKPAKTIIGEMEDVFRQCNYSVKKFVNKCKDMKYIPVKK